MKLGAEPKKVGILAGLLIVAAVVFFMNSGGSSESSYTPPPAAAPRPAVTPGLAEPPSAQNNAAGPRQQRRGSSSEFRPSVRPKRGEQRPDPMSIDPTLRLDLLAKLQTVEVQGAHRSIFDFSQPPAPKPDPAKEAAAKPPAPSPIVPVKPPDAAEEAKLQPSKHEAPPIPLKFYGYASPAGQAAKRAFFMEGEEIHVVREGEVVKRRYRIVRIGVNSVVVEDTEAGGQQTLPLEEQPG
jgi:hypothetical protein